MDYSGELAAIQQALARSDDMETRRAAVLETSHLVAGEQLIEVGCGGGLLLRQAAMQVGATGTALGIDLSPDQVEAARAHCADLGQVEVLVGDVRAIPVGDSEYDLALATQVLEYVPDVEVAILELARVLRPGGRLVNVATVWDSLFYAGGDDDLTRAVVAAWDGHAPHPNFPAHLPGLLAGAGFEDTVQRPLSILNRSFHPASFGYGAAHLIAAHARSEDAIDDEEARAWLESLKEGDARGEFFVSIMPVLTTASRPS